MRGSYNILTLEQGEFQLQFENNHKFALDIEEKTGILTVCQVYYQNGEKINLGSMNKVNKNLEVLSSGYEASKYIIHAPSNQFNVNILNPSLKTIKDLINAMISECRYLGLDYPSESYTFFLNSELLSIHTSLSYVPNNSIIELQELATYPIMRHIQINIVTLQGDVYHFFIVDTLSVEELKEIIQNEQGILIDEQRLILEGSQLNDSQLLKDYDIRDGSTIHLVLRLRGGGFAESFTFNGLNNQVKVQFSDKAPSWRIVKQGISWIGNCNNSTCPIFRKEVISNSGFGVFEVTTKIRACLCPMCNNILINVNNCGFFMSI